MPIIEMGSRFDLVLRYNTSMKEIENLEQLASEARRLAGRL
jgi:hypothetical protein